jgi:hypothetical protein
MMSLNKRYVRIGLIKWTGQVSHVGRGAVCAGFWWGSEREIDSLEGLGLAVRIILKWILQNSIGRPSIELIWLRIGCKWRAVVNLVMDLWVPQNAANIFIG